MCGGRDTLVAPQRHEAQSHVTKDQTKREAQTLLIGADSALKLLWLV